MSLQAALLAFCVLLLSGCASRSRLTANELRLLAPHPFLETQHTNGGTLVPTGVWKVQGSRSTVYVAGSFHVITKEQIPFPSTFYAAYMDASELYVESDVDQLSPLETANLLLQSTKWLTKNVEHFACPKGKTIADYVQPQTVAELEKFYGKKYSKHQHLNAVGLAFIAQAEALQEDYNAHGGVDQVFTLAARHDKKPVSVLDDSSVDQLIGLVFDAMLANFQRQEAAEGPDLLVRKNVLGAVREWGEETYWRSGDLKAIERSIEDSQNYSPALNQKLLVERNLKWMPAIKRALDGNKNVMIIVGVDHLGGPSGLIQLIKEAGYTPEQLLGVDPLRQNEAASRTSVQ